VTVSDIDVSAWPRVGDEQLGKKRKVWLREPDTNQRWLFKWATFNIDRDGASFQKGDDWAEKVTEIVGRALGVPVALLELAHTIVDGEREFGVISQSVLREQEELRHGNELLAESGLDVVHPERIGYTPRAIRAAIQNAEPPRGCPAGFTAWDAFVGYLVLDGLVGNTDRHEENWAVIANGGRMLSPSFDHASSLGFLLSDQMRAVALASSDANQRPRAWASRAHTKFEGRAHPVDVAIEGWLTAQDLVKEHWLKAVSTLPDPSALVGDLPDGRISETSKRFAAEVLRQNRERFLSLARGTV
jgi:hypothetical protein